jgi:inward rectifier potassium channel
MSENKQKEIGFGRVSATGNARALNPDGTFNVIRSGQSWFKSFELFHWLISISWAKFILTVFLWYFFVNLIFAILYHLADADSLTGIIGMTSVEKFLDEFFFSSQTLTTVGYGRIAPVGTFTSTIAAAESMIGLLGFALVTGLLYGRFSRPIAKIIYSADAIVAPYRNGKAIMFRIVNARKSQLIETEVEITALKKEKDGTRSFLQIKLERDRIALFPLSWTIVHPIDEESPFWNLDEKEFYETDPEFFVIIKAFDDTFSQTVYSRRSYVATEIKWGQKFETMIEFMPDGTRKLHIDKINLSAKTELPKSNSIE